MYGNKRRQLASKAGRGSVLLGHRNNPVVLNKNCRASPMTVRITPSLQGCLWLAFTQQHSQRVSGSTPALPQSRPLAKTETPEGNGCQRGFQSVKLPLLFHFFPACFVFWGFVAELLCFLCAEASYTKKVLICQYHKEALLIVHFLPNT